MWKSTNKNYSVHFARFAVPLTGWLLSRYRPRWQREAQFDSQPESRSIYPSQSKHAPGSVYQVLSGPPLNQTPVFPGASSVVATQLSPQSFLRVPYVRVGFSHVFPDWSSRVWSVDRLYPY